MYFLEAALWGKGTATVDWQLTRPTAASEQSRNGMALPMNRSSALTAACPPFVGIGGRWVTAVGTWFPDTLQGPTCRTPGRCRIACNHRRARWDCIARCECLSDRRGGGVPRVWRVPDRLTIRRRPDRRPYHWPDESRLL